MDVCLCDKMGHHHVTWSHGNVFENILKSIPLRTAMKNFDIYWQVACSCFHVIFPKTTRYMIIIHICILYISPIRSRLLHKVMALSASVSTSLLFNVELHFCLLQQWVAFLFPTTYAHTKLYIIQSDEYILYSARHNSNSFMLDTPQLYYMTT